MNKEKNKKEFKPFSLDIPRMGYFILYKCDNSWISKTVRSQQLKMGYHPNHAQYTHIEVSARTKLSAL